MLKRGEEVKEVILTYVDLEKARLLYVTRSLVPYLQLVSSALGLGNMKLPDSRQ